uniref:Uncharacterized protein n=1 Tax=Meloidogyne hapla TaxID=6305 RepID=A0A1I8BVR4_MELHA
MIEAFAFNIQIVCLPDFSELINIAKAWNAKATNAASGSGKGEIGHAINPDTKLKSSTSSTVPGKSIMKAPLATAGKDKVNFGQASGAGQSIKETHSHTLQGSITASTSGDNKDNATLNKGHTSHTHSNARRGEIEEEIEEVPKRFSCFGFRCKRNVTEETSFNLKYDEIVVNIKINNGDLNKDEIVNVLMDMLTTDKYEKNVFKAFNYLHDKWQKKTPQNVFFEEVKNCLKGVDEHKGLVIN